MNFKGLFANKVSTPQWKNKEGVNEFDTLMDTLAGIGKKFVNKKADKSSKPVKKAEEIPSENPTEVNVEQPAPMKNDDISVQYYDARPRPLGETFHARGNMSERAIYKAKEMLSSKIAGLDLPVSDIYLLRTDISRFAGDGTPATGRISFQMPVISSQGDSRTIYADVDIVLGGLIPPQFFTDGVNQKYAFDQEGVQLLLQGRDFEVMENPKVQPETLYFESPGHLASRGGSMMTIHGKREVRAQEPEQPKKPAGIAPGTDLANAIHELQDTKKHVEQVRKDIKDKSKELEKAIEALPEKATMVGLEKDIKNLRKQEKDAVAKISAMLEHVDGKIAEFEGDLWKISEKIKVSQAPTYSAILGSLIDIIRDKVPTIKQTVDNLWQDMRAMTSIKELIKQTPSGEPEQWEVSRSKPEAPDAPPYVPPVEEDTTAGGTRGMTRKASFSEYFQDITSALAEIGVAISDVKKLVRVK